MTTGILARAAVVCERLPTQLPTAPVLASEAARLPDDQGDVAQRKAERAAALACRAGLPRWCSLCQNPTGRTRRGAGRPVALLRKHRHVRASADHRVAMSTLRCCTFLLLSSPPAAASAADRVCVPRVSGSLPPAANPPPPMGFLSPLPAALTDITFPVARPAWRFNSTQILISHEAQPIAVLGQK